MMSRWPHSIPGAALLVVAALCSAACRPTAAAAPQGERPIAYEPVGPVPGPGVMKPTTNPYAGDALALAEGRRLFVSYNCAGCHGDHGGGGMGPSLRDVDWMYGSSDGHVFASIAQGRAHGMPAWGTRLPADHIWKLAAYVKSLRTPLEPDPPR